MTDYVRGPGLGRFLIVVLLILAVAVAGVWFYNRTHVVTVGDHVGEAIDAMPGGVSRAAGEVTDKDNLDKVGEALKDTGEAASSAMSKTGRAASSAVSATSADVKAAADRRKAPNHQKN